MYKVSLEEVRQLCKEVITGVRIKEKDESYSDSLNFYMTNDFYFEECWNLDATLAALILPRLIHFRDNRCGTQVVFLNMMNLVILKKKKTVLKNGVKF